ncbi:uncharacterized protein LOC118419753 [Branchiostoma floridae]|uniref:Uncharacterized protein LOC118419753 n=1 Tax=Branchiostoma floridae TaxID=7739 RepID=C3YZK0_BRAFL|nr:uncharacterized protein LOC118419753 [Branchiostoma floridae]|eukprot:XP_002598259.1 hypothetical protein BRAFLDRAFT_69591 [Branchiostoma floridae]
MDVSSGTGQARAGAGAGQPTQVRGYLITYPAKFCICNREPTTVLCKMCGKLFEGRAQQMECPVHPNIIHLMDHALCPACHRNKLQEAMKQKSTSSRRGSVTS